MLTKSGLQEAGKPAINFRHEFSAEIEPVKQAYIERNFQPKILFRDVRDFLRAETTTATTAYGAEVDIPSEVDILVAGFVCKDLSRLNNCGKTLKDEGESGDTWLAIYTYAKRFRPRVVLLENVKATRKTWDDLVVEWDNIGYTAAWIYRDTKTYYLPQTRERMYMIAIENSQLGSRAEEAVSGWKNTIEKLQRQCSSPYESFIADSLQEPGTYATPLSEPDWPLCKLRYDHIRSREKLGNSSPITLSSGTGTVKYVKTKNMNTGTDIFNLDHPIARAFRTTNRSHPEFGMRLILHTSNLLRKVLTRYTRWVFGTSARMWIDSGQN